LGDVISAKVPIGVFIEINAERLFTIPGIATVVTSERCAKLQHLDPDCSAKGFRNARKESGVGN
jgi:hypothetical protein